MSVTFFRWFRRVLAVTVIVSTLLLLADAITGHLVEALGEVVAVVICVTAICLQTRLIRIKDRQRLTALHPHPDYALIARMEREVYGETFRHKGSVASMFLPPELHPLVTPEVPPGLFETMAGLRRERRAGSRSDSFRLKLEEAQRLTEQVKAAQDDEHRPNLRWDRRS